MPPRLPAPIRRDILHLAQGDLGTAEQVTVFGGLSDVAVRATWTMAVDEPRRPALLCEVFDRLMEEMERKTPAQIGRAPSAAPGRGPQDAPARVEAALLTAYRSGIWSKPMGRERPIVQASLYDRDFYSWTSEQAALLRAGDVRSLNLGNIAEEIETLGRSEAAALRSSLRLIVMHLLKAIHQPEMATKSLLTTIRRERINVERSLKDNPGLTAKLPMLFMEACEDGREEALAETELASLPEKPRLTLEQVRDTAFIPASLTQD